MNQLNYADWTLAEGTPAVSYSISGHGGSYGDWKVAADTIDELLASLYELDRALLVRDCDYYSTAAWVNDHLVEGQDYAHLYTAVGQINRLEDAVRCHIEKLNPIESAYERILEGYSE